jgi:hypothetical protein
MAQFGDTCHMLCPEPRKRTSRETDTSWPGMFWNHGRILALDLWIVKLCNIQSVVKSLLLFEHVLAYRETGGFR